VPLCVHCRFISSRCLVCTDYTVCYRTDTVNDEGTRMWKETVAACCKICSSVRCLVGHTASGAVG
jgi:hypothetical protein